MFRNRNLNIRFRPQNGMQVLVRARVGLYEGRGEFQLIAEHMEDAGDGALRRAFDALRQRLEKEGLFDIAGKKALPALPETIGIITSPTGAAIHDVLSVLKKRFPAIMVIIYPVPVQGENAAAEIATMLRTAGQRNECDVLLVTRGGGSLEDLWAFNEEVLARAIHLCQLPVVTAIGHETDFTIADFVADYRAPTPSAAAEILSPDQSEWTAMLVGKCESLARTIRFHLQHSGQQLQHLQARLRQQHPSNRLKQWSQRVDDLESRYRLAYQHQYDKRVALMSGITRRLLNMSPQHKIQFFIERGRQLSNRLQNSIQQKISKDRHTLTTLSRELHAISPLATLDRGYSILQDRNKTIIKNKVQVKTGEQLFARLTDGQLTLRVEEKK